MNEEPNYWQVWIHHRQRAPLRVFNLVRSGHGEDWDRTRAFAIWGDRTGIMAGDETPNTFRARQEKLGFIVQLIPLNDE